MPKELWRITLNNRSGYFCGIKNKGFYIVSFYKQRLIFYIKLGFSKPTIIVFCIKNKNLITQQITEIIKAVR